MTAQQFETTILSLIDDMNSLSLWCVDASVSFTDGEFAAPE